MDGGVAEGMIAEEVAPEVLASAGVGAGDAAAGTAADMAAAGTAAGIGTSAAGAGTAAAGGTGSVMGGGTAASMFGSGGADASTMAAMNGGMSPMASGISSVVANPEAYGSAAQGITALPGAAPSAIAPAAQAAQTVAPATQSAMPLSQSSLMQGIPNSALSGTGQSEYALGQGTGNGLNMSAAAPGFNTPTSQGVGAGLMNTSPVTTSPGTTGTFDSALNWAGNNKGMLGLGAMGLSSLLQNRKYGAPGNPVYSGALSKYHFTPSTNSSTTQAPTFSMASGGLPSLAKGEARGETLRGTMGQLHGVEKLTTYDQGGGVSSLGGYAHGGNPRLLQGPGDGMSDSIPATIDGKQQARLASGEFVVPADVVSHLGNGSTDAGAKHLYDMMSRVRQARTGNPKQGKQIDPSKFTK